MDKWFTMCPLLLQARACVHACVSECVSEKLFVTGITVIEYENETLVGFLYAEKRKKKMKKSTGARADGNGIYIYIYSRTSVCK